MASRGRLPAADRRVLRDPGRGDLLNRPVPETRQRHGLRLGLTSLPGYSPWFTAEDRPAGPLSGTGLRKLRNETVPRAVRGGYGDEASVEPRRVMADPSGRRHRVVRFAGMGSVAVLGAF